MATTYLNGIARNNSTGYTIMGQGRLKLGHYDVKPSVVQSSKVMGVNIHLGAYSKGPNRGMVSDRAPNVPSGFNTTGMPTYGSGKANRVTTFNPDYSYASTNAKFTYIATGRAPSSKKFSTLS